MPRVKLRQGYNAVPPPPPPTEPTTTEPPPPPPDPTTDVQLSPQRGTAIRLCSTTPGIDQIQETMSPGTNQWPKAVDGGGLPRNNAARTRAIATMGATSRAAMVHGTYAFGTGSAWSDPASAGPTVANYSNATGLLTRLQEQYDAGFRESYITMGLAPPLWREITHNDESKIQAQYRAKWAEWGADIAERATAQFPTATIWFIFWNELKGYYSSTLNSWDMARYNLDYLAWANAIRSSATLAQTRVKLGGPYAPVRPYRVNDGPSNSNSGIIGTYGELDQRDLSAISSFVTNIPANRRDFIVFDGGLLVRKAGTLPREILMENVYESMNLYTDTVDYIAGLTPHPVVVAEWYAGGAGNEVEPAPTAAQTNEYRTRLAVGLLKMYARGVKALFLWKCEEHDPNDTIVYLDDPNTTTVEPTHTLVYPGRFPHHAMWTSTRRKEDGTSGGELVGDRGGNIMPMGTLQKKFIDMWAVGAPIYACTSSDPRVYALSNGTQTIAVNTASVSLVALCGDSVTTTLPKWSTTVIGA